MLKLLATCALLFVIAAPSAAQTPDPHAQPAAAAHAPADAHQPAGDHAAADDHGGGHEASFWATIGPYFNFVILLGLLYYFFRAPLAEYLQTRRTGISKDLVEAAALRTTATAQLAEIDRKVKALPGEIETLRQRGQEEILAEEQRIATQAANERERLLEQTRREIDVQLRIAKRDLVEHAADLAVQLATDRITQTITPADQDRLVDRYLGQLRSDEAKH